VQQSEKDIEKQLEVFAEIAPALAAVQKETLATVAAR